MIPADAKLTPRPKEIPAWDDMSAEQKRLFERQMETFAGFAEHTDHEVGRLVAQLETIGELDNTLFFYIVGDNGASAEGGPEGTYNEMMALNGIVGKADQMMEHIDDVGRPHDVPALRHRLGLGGQHAVPVDQAGRQPLRRHAQRHGAALAQGHQGQGRGPQPVPPRRSTSRRPRSKPRRCRSPRWSTASSSGPMDGVSMLYSADDAKAADRRTTQYFEMFGNRGIYHDGWVACTRHSIPWLMVASSRR